MKLTGLTIVQYAAVLAAAGGVAVVLYMLKLRRRRVAVPFSKLWERVLLDRQATSLLRRLKRFFSLLVQLALLWLLATALGNPRRDESSRTGRDIVVLVDTSASMRARDVGRADGRIGEARAKVRGLIRNLEPRDRMMLVAMDARVVPLTPMTAEKAVLERGVEQIRASDAPADFPRGLRLALDALSERREGHVVLVSDGVLGEARDQAGPVSLGKAQLHWLKVGRGGRNVGITSFSVRRYPISRTTCEIFLEVTNAGEQDEGVELTLVADGQETLVRRLEVDRGKSLSVTLPDQQAGGRILEARVALLGRRCQRDDDCGRGRCAGDHRCVVPDDQPADDRAYALLPERRPVRVLAVGPGNLYLSAALLLDEYLDVTEMSETEYGEWLASGAAERERPYEVVIFDAVAPPPPPRGNLLYLGVEGAQPPIEIEGETEESVWFDPAQSRRDHPVLRYVSFGDFEVYRAVRVRVARSDSVIARSEDGLPLVVVRAVEGRTTTMLTFAARHSDLPLRMAWPVLLMNAISWYVEQDTRFIASHSTGQPVHVRLRGEVDSATVCGPGGCVDAAVHEDEAVFVPGRAGIHRVSAGDERLAVAVNLTSPSESAIEPASSVVVGGTRAGGAPAMRAGVGGDIWIWLLIAALGVVIVEWLSYHRRVTV